MIGARRLRVLQTFTPDRGDISVNPYTSLLERSLQPLCDVHRFTWPLALAGRYDVLHCHWPEHLIGNPQRLRRTVAQVLFAVLLVVLRIRRIAVIRTVHNVDPHTEPDPISRRLLARLDALVVARVHLHEPVDVGPDDHVFPHGDYTAWYADQPRVAAVPGRLVYFGRILRYKNVHVLLRAFAQTKGRERRLVVAGSVQDVPLEREIRGLAARDDRVDLRLEALTDADLARAITSAEVAVVPYEYLYNSGALLLALTLGRPVVAPKSRLADSLAAEVGEEWVVTYENPLDAEKLTAALETVQGTARPDSPTFVDRDWDEQAKRLVEVYRTAVATRRG